MITRVVVGEVCEVHLQMSGLLQHPGGLSAVRLGIKPSLPVQSICEPRQPYLQSMSHQHKSKPNPRPVPFLLPVSLLLLMQQPVSFRGWGQISWLPAVRLRSRSGMLPACLGLPTALGHSRRFGPWHLAQESSHFSVTVPFAAASCTLPPPHYFSEHSVFCPRLVVSLVVFSFPPQGLVYVDDCAFT